MRALDDMTTSGRMQLAWIELAVCGCLVVVVTPDLDAAAVGKSDQLHHNLAVGRGVYGRRRVMLEP
jgi:hypothetical protein